MRRPSPSGPSPQPPLVDKLRLALFTFLRRSHRGHSRPARNREWKNHGAARGGAVTAARGVACRFPPQFSRPRPGPDGMRAPSPHSRRTAWPVFISPPSHRPIAVGFGLGFARHAHTSLTPRVAQSSQRRSGHRRHALDGGSMSDRRVLFDFVPLWVVRGLGTPPYICIFRF